MVHALLISHDEEFIMGIKNKLEYFNYKVSVLSDLTLAHVFLEQKANVFIFDTTSYKSEDVFHITNLLKTIKNLPSIYIYPEGSSETSSERRIKVLTKPIRISELLVFVDEGTRASQRLPKIDLPSQKEA